MDDLFAAFPSAENDGINLAWSHRTNSRDQLESALNNSNIHLIEADVFLFASHDQPVMSHGHGDPSNFTLIDFMDIMLASPERKGLKLDFKSYTALLRSLPLLQNLEQDERMMSKLAILWLNADILGSAGNPARIAADNFLKECAHFMPQKPLSLGWAVPFQSSDPNAVYTTDMIAEMIATTENLTIPVTFPIRASYVSRSLAPLLDLLNAKETNTLTLWHSSNDPVDESYIAGLKQLRSAVDKNRLLYDLPSEALSRLHIA